MQFLLTDVHHKKDAISTLQKYSVLQWERLKKSGMAPSKRAGFGMVTHRDRALLFGGITDRQGAGDKTYSELYNELYQLDLASQRWRPVTMKLSKTDKV